jgi:hypothetical protein
MQTMDMVKPQALPRAADGKMSKVIIAFDVDGTLIKNVESVMTGAPYVREPRQHGVPYNRDVPIVHQINMLQVLSTFKNVRIVVWSGGGKQYAETWGNRLGLDKYVWRYASKLEHENFKAMCDTLIAIDDIQSTRLGDVNLIVREK